MSVILYVSEVLLSLPNEYTFDSADHSTAFKLNVRTPAQEKVANCHEAYEQVNLIAVWLCGGGTLFFIVCSTSKQVIKS